MVVIPAIDLMGGEAVRLVQGDFAKKTVYGDDPLAVAKRFELEGAEWLHVVDLDGAKAGEPVNLEVVEQICKGTGLNVEFGGGLRTREAVESVLAVGVDRAVVGTRIAQDLDEAKLWFGAFGERLLASIDTKDGMVAVEGWMETGSVKGTELGKELVARGCQRIMTTDIATDGMLSGPNVEAMREMMEATGVPVIASGGVSDLSDLVELAGIGCEGAIVGKALYEGRIRLKDAVGIVGIN